MQYSAPPAPYREATILSTSNRFESDPSPSAAVLPKWAGAMLDADRLALRRFGTGSIDEVDAMAGFCTCWRYVRKA